VDLKDIPLDQLFLDPNNVRLHDDKNIEAIKGSLKKFGQQKNIVVDKDGIIIAGNGTYTAAKALGWKTLKCNVTTLESYEKMAFALADNRTAELASWDMPKLEEQIKLIEEPELIGFDDDFGKTDDDFEFKDPKDEKEKELKIVITFDDDEEMENVFSELNDRGLKVKIG